MSLLMDALESAEKAQRKQADDAAAFRRPNARSDTSLDALPPTTPATHLARRKERERLAAKRLFEARGPGPALHGEISKRSLLTWGLPLVALLLGGGWWLGMPKPEPIVSLQDDKPTTPAIIQTAKQPTATPIAKLSNTVNKATPDLQPAAEIKQKVAPTATKRHATIPVTTTVAKPHPPPEIHTATIVKSKQARPSPTASTPTTAKTPTADSANQRLAPPRQPAGIFNKSIISKKRLTPLEAAYRAYRRGENHRAVRMYRQALAEQPNLREAWLGLAAVALREGRLQEARRHFQTVLKRHPHDSEALAGLLGLGHRTDSAAQERHLRELLAKNPASPHLHFVLGSTLISTQRWEEARDAFSNAYRLDERNGDAAFNLAVCLDRLGLKRDALIYYKRALELAKNRTWGFAPEAVTRRIEGLSSGL
ncbi:MAG: tetratricopeptide repeat protein [Magnetococcales bacterium]|nr:tetratricopeptide repeat protein [Magnetococcales bacterium]